MKTADEILHEHGIAPPPPGKQRYYTTCPQCSANRSRAHQKAACLGVTVKGDGVTWGCNHCLWTGGGYYNGKINGPAGGRPGPTTISTSRGIAVPEGPQSARERATVLATQAGRQGGWINNTQGVRKVLYRLPEVLEAIASERTILVVEGEKDADSLWRIGIPATCSPDGASDIGKAAKWRMAYSESLGGADIVIIPDHDAAGYEHADFTAKASPRHRQARTDVDAGEALAGLPEGRRHFRLARRRPYARGASALIAQAPDYVADNTPEAAGDAGAAAPLRLVFFNDLGAQPTPKPWLIKNVMARDETSSWFGPPGKGKSALATDLTIANASGRDWRGFRTKGRCGVVYFAFERADLVRRRLIAHKLRDGLADLPIAVAGESIDLLNRSCVDVILATIHAAEQRFAHEVGLAIFDTYAKGIAAGGGDEDKAKDQNAVQANLRRLFDRGCHIHIAGVGHAGKDESKGERGSNARLADVDLQVQITGDLVKTATVLKANDQPEGCLTSFKLEPFDFDPDEDGNPFRTFIVSDEILDSDQTQRSRTKPSDRQKLALRALTEVTLARGRPAPPEYQLPPDIRVVTAEAWQEELLRSNVLDRKAGNPWARFSELRNSLAARFLIGTRDDLVWLPRPDHGGGKANNSASSNGEARTVGSIPFMITRAAKEQLRVHGFSDAQIANLTPQQAREILLASLGTVLVEWKKAIGVGETRSLDRVIEITADHPGLKAALVAVAPMDDRQRISNVQLARWLRDFNEVPVGGLQLTGGGIENGSPLWTLQACDGH